MPTLKEKTQRCYEDCILFLYNHKAVLRSLKNPLCCRLGDGENNGENNCVYKHWKLLLEIWNNFVPFILDRILALVANCKQKAKNKEAFPTWDAFDSLLITTKSAHNQDGGRLLGGSPRHVAGSCNPGITGSSLRERGIWLWPEDDLQEVQWGGYKHQMRNKRFVVFVLTSLLSGCWLVARLDDKEMYYSNELSTRANIRWWGTRDLYVVIMIMMMMTDELSLLFVVHHHNRHDHHK